MSIENFEQAFSSMTSGCRRQCACGTTYYEDNEQDYDWEEGEFEELENDDEAVGVDFGVGDISFEGNGYVNACNCWHERAEKIMKFIAHHDHQIARYLNLEREQKIVEAQSVDYIEGERWHTK